MSISFLVNDAGPHPRSNCPSLLRSAPQLSHQQPGSARLTPRRFFRLVFSCFASKTSKTSPLPLPVDQSTRELLATELS